MVYNVYMRDDVYRYIIYMRTYRFIKRHRHESGARAKWCVYSKKVTNKIYIVSKE